MNQIVNRNHQFIEAEPFLVNQRAERIVLFRPAPAPVAHHEEPATPESAWPGWPRWLAKGFRLYRAFRRTRIALDQLSHEQLKDIGYRRAADGIYERYP
ncbi:MAG: DUF1127 domain-containing protein [Parvibaculaceae bacterium]